MKKPTPQSVCRKLGRNQRGPGLGNNAVTAWVGKMLDLAEEARQAVENDPMPALVAACEAALACPVGDDEFKRSFLVVRGAVADQLRAAIAAAKS